MARFVDRTGRPGPCDLGSRVPIPTGQDDYPGRGRELVRSGGLRGMGRQEPADDLPLEPRGVHARQLAHRADVEPRGGRPRPGRQHEEHEPVRRLRSRRQRARVDVERQRPRARSASSWAAAGTTPTTRSPTPTRSRRSTARRRTASAASAISSKEPNLAALQRTIDRRIPRLPRGEAGLRRGLRAVPAAVRLRQDAARREDRRGEADRLTGLRQKITFTAAYGGERMMAYLFLPPERASRPTRSWWCFPAPARSTRAPAARSISGRDRLRRRERARGPLARSTRARTSGAATCNSDYAEATTAYKDYVIMWGKDLARSIDYVETRKDLDANRASPTTA